VPGFNLDAILESMNRQRDQFIADMHAQTQAAMQQIQMGWPQPTPGDLTDGEIIHAIHTNPELRKAVVGLVQAAKTPPTAPG